jgi:hypothetical protein
MIKPQPSFLRKAAITTAKVIVTFVILICILVVYAELKIRWAKKQIEAFSQQVTIGMPVAGLEMKAKGMQLNYGRFADSNDMNGRLYVWEGFAFGRWFCDVEYRDDKVTIKRVTFLD